MADRGLSGRLPLAAPWVGFRFVASLSHPATPGSCDRESRYTRLQGGTAVTGTPTERERDGAWARLRRRKVVQWGLGYAAVAWTLLQGLEYLVETFHGPELLRQLATLAFIFGFPVALVVAWYHGDRGEQRVTAVELAILAALLVAGGGVLWFYERRSESTPAPAAKEAARRQVEGADRELHSIAVLPFENRSRLEDDAFFVDGIHDDILTQAI